MNLKLKPNLKLMIFALFMGILFGLNHIIGLIFRKGYSPFNVTDIWELDQIYYATRMHYVSLTGHISSIYSFSDIIPILFFGFMNKFISIDKIFMVAPFIFIPILVYMIYLFEKELGISDEYAILGTVSVLCLQAAAIIPWIYHSRYLMISYFARFPEIMFSGILFFGTLILILRKKYVLSGIMTGLQLYVYFYYGSFLIGLLFICIVINRKYLKSVIIACLLSIPALYIAAITPQWVHYIVGVPIGIIPIPQTWHYYTVIDSPLLIILCVYIAWKFNLFRNKRIVFGLVSIIILLALNHQIEYGLSTPKTSPDDIILQRELNSYMFDQDIKHIYPSWFFLNSFDEIKQYMIDKNLNLIKDRMIACQECDGPNQTIR
jgi:hypothetical protein